MKPLRVTAHMSEPVVYDGDGLHLDGPLAWAAFMERTTPEEREALPPVGFVDVVPDEDLPLARVVVVDGDPLGWVWAASAVHADWEVFGAVEVRKKPATAEMGRYTDSPSFNLGLGHMKAWDLRMPARFSRSLVWYCVGDLEGVKHLLDRVPSIGRKSRHGSGRVIRWEVETWDHNWSVVRDGHLTRSMPAAYRPDAVPSRGAVRVPYHHRSRICAVVQPRFNELRP